MKLRFNDTVIMKSVCRSKAKHVNYFMQQLKAEHRSIQGQGQVGHLSIFLPL